MPDLKALLPLETNTFNADPRGEEFASLTPQFDIEMGNASWRRREDCRYLKPAKGEEIRFRAFVDGVQRTVMVGRFVSSVAPQVPLHAFEVVGGNVFRGEDRRVRAANWMKMRGIVGPFAVASEDEAYAKRVAEALEEALGVRVGVAEDLGEDPMLPLKERAPELWVFDSSLVGIGGATGRLIEKKELYNDARVRLLALAKVAHARQVLELGVHLALRAEELGIDSKTLLPSLRARAGREDWVLHDGPLFFTRRRRRMMVQALGLSGGLLDKVVLGRTVG